MQITIDQLTKTYRGGVTALETIDLDIGTGMFGLLGANGAGKTTLMRILAGILHPTSGTVRIDGHDLNTPAGRTAVKRTLGYLPQELGLYPDLTARAFLDYIAILKGITNRATRRAGVDGLLQTVALTDVAGRRLGTFSGGMKQRVGIAQALLGDPQLLIVDEPTAGLDPEERIRFRTLLTSLAGERTVLLSTHIVEDIASSSRRLAILGKGRILYAGDSIGVVEAARGRVWTARSPQPPPPHATVVSALHLGDTVEYRLIADQAPLPHAEPAEPGLEDGYMALMRERLDPDATALATSRS